MVETAVYAQWIPRLGVDIAYANWRQSKTLQGEVDIIGMNLARQKPAWAVEIKWTDIFAQNPDSLTSLLHFLPENGLKQALVTSKTQTIRHEMKDVTLQFIPVACYTYIVSQNTISKNKQMYDL